MAKRKKNKSRSESATKAAETRKKEAQRASVQRQTAAVLLFALAIFVACVALIPGANVWSWLHKFLLGLFGICAYILPALLVYIAVFVAKDEKPGNVTGKLWQCILLLAMVGSAIHIFTYDAMQSGSYFQTLGQGYMDGIESRGGGFLGAILGHPFELWFTDVGAKIIIFLLIFVFLMLVTGTTIIALFRMLWKPVKKTKEGIENVMIAAEEKKNAAIDVDLGDGYIEMPEHPVKAEKKSVTVDAKDREKKREKSEKEIALLEAARKLNEAEDSDTQPVEKAKKEPKPKAAEEPPAEKVENTPEVEEDPYHYPPFSLLDDARPADVESAAAEQKQIAETLVKTLQEFGVNTTVLNVSRGPSVTRYELQPSAGVKISRITGLADDIALRLATSGVRIEAPIPNKAAVGIEVPNKVSSSVCLREILDSSEFKNAKSKLTVALGKDISGNTVVADLAKMPHLLIAGTTGSGKSVCTNSMIQSILFRASPSDVRMLLIDPKQVEFSIYNGIPHLLVPVVSEPRKAAGALGWAVTEMLNRYKIFAENNVRNLSAYNELAKKSETLQTMPQILIVIDELADLMMAAANEVEDAIIRLAQMARAAGMHLVIATQRPSVDVITGLIKANIPSRLALTVASAVDSRTILDSSGAEKLLGKGDMLFMPVGMSKPQRVQGCFVSQREVESVVEFLKATDDEDAPHPSDKAYDDAQIMQEIERQAAASGKGSKAAVGDDEGGEQEADPMLQQAIETVVEAGMASTSLLQRKLRLGYARAGRIIDEMEQRGIVGPHEGSKPRQVLITRQQWLEMSINRPDDEE